MSLGPTARQPLGGRTTGRETLSEFSFSFTKQQHAKDSKWSLEVSYSRE